MKCFHWSDIECLQIINVLEIELEEDRYVIDTRVNRCELERGRRGGKWEPRKSRLMGTSLSGGRILFRVIRVVSEELVKTAFITTSQLFTRTQLKH